MCVRVSETNRKSDMSPSIYIKVRIIDNRPKKKKQDMRDHFFLMKQARFQKAIIIHSFVHLMKLEN